MIQCTKCGGQNDDAARHCANCAAPFSESDSWRPVASAEANPQQQPPGNAWDAQPASPPMMRAPGLQTIGLKRDPLMVIVFSLLTFGIYGIWWWYTMISEIKSALNRQDINPAIELLLAFVTCGIYGIYIHYKYPKLMVEMQQRTGMPPNDISTICVILPFFGLGIISVILMQSELNKIWEAARR